MSANPGFFRGLNSTFSKERPPNPQLQKEILATLKKLHISCGNNFEGPGIIQSAEDFIGLCILYKDGNKVLTDSNGRRIKSGYIAAQLVSSLTTPTEMVNTFHRQTYNKLFGNIEKIPGVMIVGFSQKNKLLKGTSGTFNTRNCTNLVASSKECLFSYRCLIFGAIILHKLNKARDITPASACLCVCLFLIIKNQGDPKDLERFPIANFELDNQQVILEEMCHSFGVKVGVLDAAFHPNVRGKENNRKNALKLTKQAMKELMDGLKADLTPEEFETCISALVRSFEGPVEGVGGGPTAPAVAPSFMYEVVREVQVKYETEKQLIRLRSLIRQSEREEEMRMIRLKKEEKEKIQQMSYAYH